MKIQLKIILFLLLFPLLTYGQSNFSFGINFNTERSLIIPAKAISRANNFGLRGKGIGYSGGLQMQYDFSDELFLRSGFNFQIVQHQFYMEGLFFGSSVDPIGTDPLVSDLYNRVNISSIGFPIDIGHWITTNKNRVKCYIGLGGIIYVHTSVLKTENFISPNNNEVKPSFYSIGCFMGIAFNLGKRIELGIEPNIRLTPNKFRMTLLRSEGRTLLETGLTLRVRFINEKTYNEQRDN